MFHSHQYHLWNTAQRLLIDYTNATATATAASIILDLPRWCGYAHSVSREPEESHICGTSGHLSLRWNSGVQSQVIKHINISIPLPDWVLCCVVWCHVRHCPAHELCHHTHTYTNIKHFIGSHVSCGINLDAPHLILPHCITLHPTLHCRYGNDSATAVDIASALEKCNLLETIEKLPKGLQTSVGERGARLSGGERQKVSIARWLKL